MPLYIRNHAIDNLLKVKSINALVNRLDDYETEGRTVKITNRESYDFENRKPGLSE